MAYWKAQRPLSQFHSSLTSGSFDAIRRSTTPRRWSVRIEQPRGAVLADARGRQEVERPRPEPVRRAGQRAHRADLHGVAGEVRLERLVLVDADLLQGAPLDERDERVAGDLVGEPGAARAEHAPLPVEQHLAEMLIGLG